MSSHKCQAIHLDFLTTHPVQSTRKPHKSLITRRYTRSNWGFSVYLPKPWLILSPLNTILDSQWTPFLSNCSFMSTPLVDWTTSLAKQRLPYRYHLSPRLCFPRSLDTKTVIIITAFYHRYSCLHPIQPSVPRPKASSRSLKIHPSLSRKFFSL